MCVCNDLFRPSRNALTCDFTKIIFSGREKQPPCALSDHPAMDLPTPRRGERMVTKACLALRPVTIA